jgi:putative ABC transport system substrate-binding protein
VERISKLDGYRLTSALPEFIVSMAVCLALAGCAVALVVVEKEPTDSPSAPQTKVKPKPQAKAKPKPVDSDRTSKPLASTETEKPKTKSPREPLIPLQALPGVAILVSKDIPAYSQVSSELAKRLQQRHNMYWLNGDPVKNAEVIDRIQRSEHVQVVAIGLRAARAAQKLSGKQVIFCQVFNYQDYELVTPSMKGISVLPRPSEQFRIWKTLAPGLHRVAVITGPNLEPIVSQARLAADAYGIKLLHEVVGSDKELLHAFKRLITQTQGLWLLPDNRVLSGGVIRAVMSYSVREGKQVLVFTPALLETGGLLSIKNSESDVAVQVLTRLRQAYGRESVPGPELAPLTKAIFQINARMAEHFGLLIPAQYRQFVYEP